MTFDLRPVLPAWHPGCAIRGHHSRDDHKAYCRPAIDAAWAEYRASLREDECPECGQPIDDHSAGRDHRAATTCR